MPSHKPIDHNNKAAMPKQQQKQRGFHSPASQTDNAGVSSNDKLTPLDAWLSPGGTRKPAKKRSLSEIEGVAKKLKMHDGSPAASDRPNVRAKIMTNNPMASDNDGNKGYELKSPPELLYKQLANTKKEETKQQSDAPGSDQVNAAFETNCTSPSLSSSQQTGESTQESQDGIDEKKPSISLEFNSTLVQNSMIPGYSNSNSIMEQSNTNNNSDDAVVRDDSSNQPAPCALESEKPRHVEINDDAELQRAIQLSLQAEEEDEARRRAQEAEELEEALRLSVAELVNQPRPSSRSNYIQEDGHDVIELSDTEEDSRFESLGDFYNNLTREQFQQFFDDFFNSQAKGGIEAVERGTFVKEGSDDKSFRKGVAKIDVGNGQEKAQYGRLSIAALYQIIDSLPAGKMKAFMDIGMGIGVQVLQAGLVYGVKARGIEIMSKRFMIADELLKASVAYFRTNPPDASKVRMLQGDFARGFPDGRTVGQADPLIRDFLLCGDLSEEERKGLVIFVNNAEAVFDARSNYNGKSLSLDAFLAELFGNLPVGVCFVTFSSLTKYFERKDWWSQDVFELEEDCVSWSIKTQPCYVLTKTKDRFLCDNDKCKETCVVNLDGRLQVDCVYCGKQPPRATKRENAGKKSYRED